ncbi:MAG: 2-amino-4-hydroxy-6-hydroxymethyldihydropteridine diphosphokinase [Marinilabiliales bacterium]|nr:2-amino-4-hydroxy-6-hydroxymethyldihydropteridine diphosphokinase [Marinilabiliales bacterium]
MRYGFNREEAAAMIPATIPMDINRITTMVSSVPSIDANMILKKFMASGFGFKTKGINYLGSEDIFYLARVTAMKKNVLYLSLGSNQGDRIDFLNRGLEAVSRQIGIIERSRLRFTRQRPWGFTDNSPF